MINVNDHEELSRLVGMYFDQQLDPPAQTAFLQKVDSDPDYQQAYQHEMMIRSKIKKHIHRPVDSSQLVQAIRNQILKP